MTFNEWFTEFHNVYCKNVLSYDCSSEYTIINKKHYYPIADMELTDIKPMHIQQCMNTAKDYSASRKRKVYYLLKRCFNEAIVNEYAVANPVEKIKPPRKVKKNINLLTAEQLQFIFRVETPITRMFMLELWTGLRRGEILALRWENINFTEGYINVCQTLVSAENHAQIRNSTKSNKDRLVPLCDESRRILNAVRASDGSPVRGYVFHNDNGDPLSFRAYHDRYKAFYKERQEERPDIPYITPHKLRHTYATYLLQNGTDIETARQMLGHSSIQTTAIYVHTTLNRMQTAANNLKFY